LRANLGQHLLDQLSRLGQSGFARFAVRGRAGEVAQLGKNGLLELRDVDAAHQHQFGAQEAQQVKQGRDRCASSLAERNCRMRGVRRGDMCHRR